MHVSIVPIHGGGKHCADSRKGEKNITYLQHGHPHGEDLIAFLVGELLKVGGFGGHDVYPWAVEGEGAGDGARGGDK